MQDPIIDVLNERDTVLRVVKLRDIQSVREERVRIRAYLLSERYGHPPGRAQEFWRTATAIENDC